MNQRPRQILRAACAGLQVAGLVLGMNVSMAQKTPGGEAGTADTLSLVNANERMRLSPDLCRDLGFIAGTVSLSATTPQAIAGIRRVWAEAPADKNNVVLVVRPDKGLQGKQASEQARARAIALGTALVEVGIPQSDVFVELWSPRTTAVALSCPPVATVR